MFPCRRNVLKSALGAATAAMVHPLMAMAAPARPKGKLKSFGLILGSVNRALAEDPAGTLKRLARLGYTELEFSSPPKDVPADKFKRMITSAGLKPLAGGAAMHQLNTAFDEQVQSAHTFGRNYLVCYWPWADKGKDKRLDDWKRLADRLNQLGTEAKKQGLTFAYHNHDIEFARTEDQIPYDVLLAQTDPALVSMELDIYWIYKGGQDAVAYIEKHPGRFRLFHVKDMDKTEAGERVCVGEGMIPFSAVFAALAKQPHEQHYFWEREGKFDAATEMACATQSAQHIKRLRF